MNHKQAIHRHLKHIVQILGALAAIAIVFALYVTHGTLAAILAPLLFAAGYYLIPGLLALAGRNLPVGLKKLFGKLHWILACKALEEPRLVQNRQHNTSQLVPARQTTTMPDDADTRDGKHTREELYINGSWQPLDSDTPLRYYNFGLTRFAVINDVDKMHHRSPESSHDERSGIPISDPPDDTNDGNTIYIDVLDAFHGIKEACSPELLQRAEDRTLKVMAEKQATNTTMILGGGILGLLLGSMVGFAVLFMPV